jgi:hypothetical protein
LQEPFGAVVAQAEEPGHLLGRRRTRLGRDFLRRTLVPHEEVQTKTSNTQGNHR